MAAVYIDYRTISWGAPNEDDQTDVWQIEDGSKDPGEILLANFGTVGTPINNFPAPATIGSYSFAFWNATDGVSALQNYPSTSQFLNIPDMPAGVLHATAWYAMPGGPTGTGGPGLRGRTFDVDLNNFRKETPIESANPAAAWAGPNNHGASSANGDATVSAKGKLIYPTPAPAQPPGQPDKFFKSWQKIVGNVDISASHASVKKGESALAVAFVGRGNPPSVVGRPATGTIYDYWAEFWARLGAEGEGPFGPRGPGEPWGPFVARALAGLSPVERGIVQGVLNSVKALAANQQRGD